jgi:hypothetical protein
MSLTGGRPKTVIYLDQFVVSNITKALDPDYPRRERVLREPFWLDLYKKLDRLLRLQLIVCPDSYHHRTESLLSGEPSFDSLQDVYSYLSNDCTFQDAIAILQRQILLHFSNYLEGRPEMEPVIAVDEIVSGELNEWQETIAITVPYRPDASEATSVRGHRKQQHVHLELAFKIWQEDSGGFEKSVEEEAQALGRAILEGFLSHIRSCLSFQVSPPQSPLDWLPPPAASIVYDMFRVQEELGVVDPIEQLQKAGGYLQSPHLLRVPFVRLSAMLYAALARKAEAGRRRPPSPGTITDVSAIASLLPYCHAMFLDKEMAGYLQEEPLREEVRRFGTEIFSLNSRDRFMAFLNGLEEKAGAPWAALVEHVYGSDWLQPFLSVVVDGKERRRRDEKRG